MSLMSLDSSERIFRRVYYWFYQTPERALNHAYQAAVALKELEEKHFDGQPIDSNSPPHSSRNRYFCARRDKLLREARMRLSEFRWATKLLGDATVELSDSSELSADERVEALLAKLNFVDQVIARYAEPLAVKELPKPTQSTLLTFFTNKNKQGNDRFEAAAKTISPSQKTGVIPRSILRTGRRIKRELDLNREDEVLQEYQISSYRTKRTARFLLILILVPLLTQQVSKKLVFAPIIESITARSHIEIPLSTQLEREAIEEIDFFEKQLRFEANAGIISPISASEYREIVDEKTQEVVHKFSHERIAAIENVFADLLAAGVFAWILFANPKAVRLLKSFIDDLVYGLSDSAKAFLIIVTTDMFVGFHSTHGWEVLLEGLAHHFGLPENRDFIFLFIATFPVILDAIFKYWIFRYLSRVSPSAVATYRNMNE